MASRDEDLIVRREMLDEGPLLLSVAGEVDLHTARGFEQAVESAFSDIESAVIVDLTDCGFLSTAGLAVLVRANRRSAVSNTTLRLVVNNQALLDLFRIAGLDGVFSIHPTRQSAVEALR